MATQNLTTTLEDVTADLEWINRQFGLSVPVDLITQTVLIEDGQITLSKKLPILGNVAAEIVLSADEGAAVIDLQIHDIFGVIRNAVGNKMVQYLSKYPQLKCYKKNGNVYVKINGLNISSIHLSDDLISLEF